MYLIILCIVSGVLFNALGKPLDGTTESETTFDERHDVVNTPIEISRSYSDEGRNAKDQPPPSNPLAGLPTLFSNGSPSSPSSGMPPVMVLGMHQAIIVPLSSLPGIFQNMMNGLFNTGNSQQAINLVPGIQNVMG